jgi:hypothetical protein
MNSILKRNSVLIDFIIYNVGCMKRNLTTNFELATKL